MRQEFGKISIHTLGAWRNGRRYGLKIRWPQGREGSSPSAPISIIKIFFSLLNRLAFGAEVANESDPLSEI
jgi:hypothetical protein